MDINQKNILDATIVKVLQDDPIREKITKLMFSYFKTLPNYKIEDSLVLEIFVECFILNRLEEKLVNLPS